MVLAAGDPAAPPLVFFHGGGTFHGWAFAEPWTSQYRVLIPYHPGFGESGDLDGLREVHDLVLHYIELFDQLGLTSDVNLVGFSVGGLLAARFAIEQKHRLRRLVLVAPAGLRVPGIDVDDFFRIPPEELPGRLVRRMDTLLPHLPTDPHDVDFIVDRYRETRTMAIMLWEHPFDPVLLEVARPRRHPRPRGVGRERRAHAGGPRSRVGGPHAPGHRGDVPRGRAPGARRVGRCQRPRRDLLRGRLTCRSPTSTSSRGIPVPRCNR